MSTVTPSAVQRCVRPLPQLGAPPFIVRRPRVRVYGLAPAKGGLRR